MTYQGIEFNHTSAGSFPAVSKGATRKTIYNVLAVVALMAAAGVVASAYHPSESTAVSNPRFESMGIKHVPTTFRGAPPAN